ncbi:hypothetical protein GFM07_26525 [Rhizobium leguminosarum bv. viciae]|nr:hypothetical protein [Rhizobium leguminosarum bv. viciae]
MGAAAQFVGKLRPSLDVILGLVPRICCALAWADARDKPEHDEREVGGLCQKPEARSLLFAWGHSAVII